MKKLFLGGALALSLLFNPYNSTAVVKRIKSKVQQVNIIKDGMYDNHNAFVDESKYSLDVVLESIELVVHEVEYSINYETLDGKVFSTTKKGGTMSAGVVIEKKDGKAYILTNNHLTEEGIPPAEIEKIPSICKWVKIEKVVDKLYLVKEEGTFRYKIEAKEVASDESLDVALLELEDSENLKKFPYKIGDSDDLRPGDFIWFVGNPLGLMDYALHGNVSKTVSPFSLDWFMISGDVQKGYSGGAVVAIRDGEYELVGLVVATMAEPADDGTYDVLGGYGLAIKINPAMNVVNNYFDSLNS